VSVVVTECEFCGHRASILWSPSVSEVVLERECCHQAWVLWSPTVSSAVQHDNAVSVSCPVLSCPVLSPTDEYSNAVPLCLLRDASNFGTIWSAFGQHEFQNTQRMNKYKCNCTYYCNCVFFYTKCAMKSRLMVIGNIRRRNAIHI
jgi:hypothetical protein